MHKTISISFIFLYVLAMFRPVQPVLYYFFNQDYIAQYLCVNKDKPAMHCNGKCFLMKQIKENNQSNEEHSLAIQLENYPIGFVYIFSLNKQTDSVSFLKHTHFYKDDYSYLFVNSLFHPPWV